jgi:hypothetical protein
MISALQGRCAQGGPKPNVKSQDIMYGCLESNLLPVSGLASRFQVLREELEISSAGGQLYRLRRRAPLAQFYDDYIRAQADPHAFMCPERSKELPAEPLKATRKRKRTPFSNVAKRRCEWLSTLVHNHIVDLMFPSLILSHQTAKTDEGKAKRAERAMKRTLQARQLRTGEQMGSHGLHWSNVSVWEYYYSYHQISWTRSK